MTAGLRGMLITNPQNADIEVTASSPGIALPFFNQVNASLERTFQKDLGPSQFSIETRTILRPPVTSPFL